MKPTIPIPTPQTRKVNIPPSTKSTHAPRPSDYLIVHYEPHSRHKRARLDKPQSRSKCPQNNSLPFCAIARTPAAKATAMVDQKTVSEEDTFGVEKPNIKGEEEEKDPEEVDEPVKNAGDDEEIRRKIEELRIGDGKSDEEDGEEESETEEDGEDGDEKEKKVESQLIERGPVRWRDEKTQFHQLPYYYQVRILLFCKIIETLFADLFPNVIIK